MCLSSAWQKIIPSFPADNIARSSNVSFAEVKPPAWASCYLMTKKRSGTFIFKSLISLVLKPMIIN